jgi:hypothetical protein
MTSRNVICPVCKEQGSTSTVRGCGTEVTCLGYFPYHDEAGVYHSHNPNRHTTMHRCSLGHLFEIYFYLPCPSCGYEVAPEKVTVIS